MYTEGDVRKDERDARKTFLDHGACRGPEAKGCRLAQRLALPNKLSGVGHSGREQGGWSFCLGTVS